MTKMKFEIDLESVKADVLALPAEIAALADVEPGAHHLYREGDNGFTLDTAARDELAGELDKMAAAQSLKAENATLRKARDRQLVTETIRAGLLRVGVKPALLEGALALFLQTHKIAVRTRKDGTSEVVVLGKHGGASAAEAAVQFMSDQQAAATFADANTPDPDSGGGAIAAAFKRLH